MFHFFDDQPANPVPLLNLNFAASKTLDPRITFTRASTGTYFDANGVMQTAAINEPRFDTDPVTLESLGLLIEEQRTNVHPNSEQFDNAYWTKANCAVTQNAITSPDGTLTADKVSQSGASTAFIQSSPTVIAGTAYTASLFVKAGDYDKFYILYYGSQFNPDLSTFVACLFDLTNKTAVMSSGNSAASNYGIVDVGNGWFRVWLTATAQVSGASPNQFFRFADPNAAKYMYVWGAQLEAGAFPTSYIKTEAASVTRSADVANITSANFSSWYRQDQGTFTGLFNANGSNTARVFSVLGADGDLVDDYSVFVFPATGKAVSTNLFSSGVNIVRVDCNDAYSRGQKVKFSASIQPAYRQIVANNTGIVSGSQSFTNPVMLSMYIGQRLGGDFLNGHLSYLRYYPRLLSDYQLQKLSKLP